MTKPIIGVHELSKQYRLGVIGATTLRDSFDRFCQRFRRNGNDPSSIIQHPASSIQHPGSSIQDRASNNDTIWALKDVSFEVQQGEVLGIIGRNGAGKSTLLKILSRITEPTSGTAIMRGRVASLLEVGTGFHPELTGRENITLNGAILGMSRREIQQKFDEIVAFAEIEKFIDTPVKRYSSGMYVRLAFAVAAHLEPEILLVDEVLAVGDAAFQKKCLGKMGDVAREGRTVLFVSHNMQAITTLCGRAFLLREGEVRLAGHTREVVEKYLESPADQVSEVVWDFENAPGNEVARLRAVRVLNERGEAVCDHDIAKPITLEMEFWVLRRGIVINSSFHVYNRHGICLFGVSNLHDPEWGSRSFDTGLYRSACCIPAHYLNEGQHQLSAFVSQNKTTLHVQREEVVSFFAHDYGATRGGYTGGWIGVVRPLLPWTMERVAVLP